MRAPEEGFRELGKQWDYWTIAAAMLVSFLGTFTSTQLMIQARLSARFSSVLIWVVLISLTFGFCASWGLHFVGMLACELDLPVSLDIATTVLSAMLAVMFTFTALGTELLWKGYRALDEKRVRFHATDAEFGIETATTMPLLPHDSSEEEDVEGGYPHQETATRRPSKTLLLPRGDESAETDSIGSSKDASPHVLGFPEEADDAQHFQFSSVPVEESRYDSGQSESSGAPPLDDLQSMAYQGITHNENAFVATLKGVYGGMSWKAFLMGLVWSLSLTSMHYVGLSSMRFPGEGYITWEPPLVFASAMISWVVCTVGYIYMVNTEPFLSQQVLFSVVAALGIAAMHFTGMRATHFWSKAPPGDSGGYPSQLPIVVCSVAILTCMLANGLLAHDATVSRNKLAEIVWTRKKLWRTLAQKENAEAAAIARSNFIALASHEIRTPLHHLQGYSDLLSRTELNEEGTEILVSIQRAIKTLSLITNNVLDWSKLESNRDALCRPSRLDMRSVCESILVLLPNKEDEDEVEMMVVVAPDVPQSILLDETYIQRILMNLLSNSLKFTISGYVMLSLEMSSGNLVAKVRDTGIGVPASFIDHLFEPFSQAQTRGSQRGTGLGLSIVKQLLQKMDGTVTVKSRHTEQGLGSNKTGTTFTVTIPVRGSFSNSSDALNTAEAGTIAIFSPRQPRTLEGLRIAWRTFGFEVAVVNDFAELSTLRPKYVWADSWYLEKNPECLQKLTTQRTWTVLVPYDRRHGLQRLAGLLSSPHIIPLQRPLLWHTIESHIAIANRAISSMGSSHSLRAAAVASDADLRFSKSPVSSMLSKNVNVLLVEDNPVSVYYPLFCQLFSHIQRLTRIWQINQKLGNRMLTSLGYTVLLASDGDEAVAKTMQHDSVIDMILMDQSMPIKDGITATREIRALEASGELLRRHPIVAVTAVVDTDSRAQFKDAGADDFLAKPLSLGKLEQTLATFLRVE
ncbi:hypothetical protein BP5796_02463 [Coleophoma crateriformis]|uniref:Uncharacterized protein n=1 Tax=Coleophoma crateriformis TaxID=565419 RepID=A0A3D8SZW5_9HELO|nr:hypothetical protein BP5796_02463 [Coleophoma crateriformis]